MTNNSIPFTKMHGLGNDFIIINTMTKPIHLTKNKIIEIANRHLGVGCDQLLLLETSQAADFFCRIFNTDGSEALQCGNGLRALARYIHEEKLHAQASFRIETKAGIFPVQIDDYDHIRATLNIPVIQEKLASFKNISSPISIVSIGNPHAILKIAAIENTALEQIATQIAHEGTFKNGVNVGLMEIVNPRLIHLRTYERGSGETLACGSNACAAVAAGITNNWLEKRVTVQYQYGSLRVEWEGEGQPIHLIGPASRVFEGVIK